MTLQPGEAAVLIIRRSDSEPTTYYFALRRSKSSFEPTTKDLQLQWTQQPILEIGEHEDFDIALNKAIAAIKKIRP